MEKMIKKLEKEERIKELNPKGTLERLGFKESQTFCDIGAGTGIFTVEAAKISSGNVYALDISEDMLKVINEKAKTERFENIFTIIVDSEILNLPSESCDLVLLSTVLHEIDNKSPMIREIKRVLNKNGKLAIIEFYKVDAPYGPPVDEKISPEEMDDILGEENLNLLDSFEISERFYCRVYNK